MRRRVTLLVLTAGLFGVVSTTGCTPVDHRASPAQTTDAATRGPTRGSTRVPSTAPGGRTPATPTHGAPSQAAVYQDPARYAPAVLRHAREAGINPQLLMAILYNEAYKPHDPAAERAWQRLKPDAAFGVANMHRAAFEDTRQGRGFEDREWTELPDDPELAIEAAAWYVHDLNRALPGRWSGSYSRDELLALGYNAGPGNMAAFADGARPGTVAQGYLDKLHANWDAAGRAVKTGG